MVNRSAERISDDVGAAEDTFALLLDEIARLESELATRDAELQQRAAAPALPYSEGPSEQERDLRKQVQTLIHEISERDETLALLLEHLSLYETAAAAQQAEWEQLHEWVAQVERRVEGREFNDSELRDELETQRQRADGLQVAIESERRAAENDRRQQERELERLRNQVASAGDPAEVDARLATLEEENLKLRAALSAVEVAEQSVKEHEELTFHLANMSAQLEEARRELVVVVDERLRERNESAAEIAALKSELAQQSLARISESTTVLSGEGPAGASSAIEADERIRAFRLHLKELHEREAARRKQSGLAGRLSRLWHHTGPT